MKTIYKKLICVLLLLILIICLHDQSNFKKRSLKKDNKENLIVEIKTKKGKIKKPLEDYLVGVLAGEMPGDFELEALKAQAVASRTFVLSRNLKVDNTTNSQVYLTDEQMKNKWGSSYQKYKDKIEKAIQETRGETMTYDGDYISALFFSSSNGRTVNSEDYFQGEVAYLKAVDSHWDLTIDPKNTREQSFTKEELKHIFQKDITSIKVKSYTESGYVKDVLVNQQHYTGREIREELNLSSSSFKIKKTKNGYTFITQGSGHGVGMSQYGAQAMAKEGYSYLDILHHYYQNIEIKRID